MKTIVAILLPLLFIAIFLTSIGYVAFRLRTLFSLKKRWPLRIVIATLFIGSTAAMLGAAQSVSPIVGMLNILGGYIFTFYIFLLLLLLGFQVVQIKWRPNGKKAGGIIFALSLGITGAGGIWANSFSVTETEIALLGIQKEVRVMHISDVHIGHHRGRDYLSKIVEETNRQKPDVILILINGDLVDSNVALLPGVLSPLADFEAPVYFVGGNHDNYVDTERAFKLIADYGVRILHNEVVEIHGLQLVGLDYMNPDDDTFDMHPSEDKRTIKGELPKLSIDPDKPTLLMHHSPVGSQYAVASGIDLMVAGHTHAGQVFPGNLFAELIFPFNRGLYQKDGMKIFVSQGAGTFMPRVRLGTSNEINLLRLKP